MNVAPLALQVSSVKTLGYYHGSSSSLPGRAVATVLRRRESNASTQRGGYKTKAPRRDGAP